MALISKLRSLGAATMLCLCGAADATTYLVAPCGQDGWSGVLPVAPDGPKLTIQAAIDAALDGDSILVYPGVYTEQIDFDGKAISLVSTGGRDVTFIDGAGSGPVVTCNSLEGADTVLQGFTIVGGGATANGSGMLVALSSPTIVECDFSFNGPADHGGGIALIGSASQISEYGFSQNSAITGGAMYVLAGSPTIDGCLFEENQADTAGGAVSLVRNAQPQFDDCRFESNGVSVASGIGGAMSVSQSGTDPTGCQFADNTAFGGGAIASEASTIDATSCDLNDNTSETDGGGTEPSTSPTCWPCRRHGVCAPRRAARLISTRTGRSTRSTCC